MEFTKKTFVVRKQFYERLRREAFFNDKYIKDVLDEILEVWCLDNPEPDSESSKRRAVSLPQAKAEMEIQQITAAMEKAKYNRSNAAKMLNKTRMWLYNKCKEYELEFPSPKRK